jgi:hypothetical protein
VGTLLRYLISFGMHLAWHRSGKSGTPPLRVPFGKGKGGPLPAIAPWQLMAAMWLAQRIWARYGDDIQHKLDESKDALLDRVDNVVRGGLGTGNAPAHKSSTPAPNILAPRAAPNYQTQVLDSGNQSVSTPSSPLPPGSVLSGLRGTS